jgi:hypothetical protein
MGQSSSSIYSKSQLDAYCRPTGKFEKLSGWVSLFLKREKTKNIDLPEKDLILLCKIMQIKHITHITTTSPPLLITTQTPNHALSSTADTQTDKKAHWIRCPSPKNQTNGDAPWEGVPDML